MFENIFLGIGKLKISIFEVKKTGQITINSTEHEVIKSTPHQLQEVRILYRFF